MPFQSKAQQAYMFIHHPDIAKRWARDYGVGSNLPQHKLGQKHPTNPQSQSHETWTKGIKKLPRPSGHSRDFAGLKPSHVARHSPKRANEAEAMSEGTGVTFQHGSRHSELGKPERLQGFRKRDVLSATSKLPHVKNR